MPLDLPPWDAAGPATPLGYTSILEELKAELKLLGEDDDTTYASGSATVSPATSRGDDAEDCPGKLVQNIFGEEVLEFCGRKRCRHHLKNNCHSGSGCKFCHCGEPLHPAEDRPELLLKGAEKWRYYLETFILEEDTEDHESILARIDAFLASKLICLDIEHVRQLVTMAFARLFGNDELGKLVVSKMHRVFASEPLSTCASSSSSHRFQCECGEQAHHPDDPPPGLKLSVRLPVPCLNEAFSLSETLLAVAEEGNERAWPCRPCVDDLFVRPLLAHQNDAADEADGLHHSASQLDGVAILDAHESAIEARRDGGGNDDIEQDEARRSVVATLRSHADAGLRSLLEKKDNKSKLGCLLESADTSVEKWSLASGFQFKPPWLKGLLNKLLYWIAFLQVLAYWPHDVDRTLYPLRDPCDGLHSQGPHLLTPYIQRALVLLKGKADEAIKAEERRKALMKEKAAGADGSHKKASRKRGRGKKGTTQAVTETNALPPGASAGDRAVIPATGCGFTCEDDVMMNAQMQVYQQEIDKLRYEFQGVKELDAPKVVQRTQRSINPKRTPLLGASGPELLCGLYRCIGAPPPLLAPFR
mmetsp:Transcript_13533/g.30789  ORF Transcript_13533/g.30789 Transcript_13533/m.30789 type:complete len:589 (-) Transcript_13533:40-1806(-)